MSESFMEKYRRLKERDESRRLGLDADDLKRQNDKLNHLFKINVAKRIFDWESRQELINDFSKLSIEEKRAFLKMEFGVNPDTAPDPKPGELKEGLTPHDETKRDLKVPVCRKCGKPHNPFDPCFGI